MRHAAPASRSQMQATHLYLPWSTTRMALLAVVLLIVASSSGVANREIVITLVLQRPHGLHEFARWIPISSVKFLLSIAVPLVSIGLAQA